MALGFGPVERIVANVATTLAHSERSTSMRDPALEAAQSPKSKAVSE